MPQHIGSMQVTEPVADILDMPGGRRERQLLFGQQVQVLERDDQYAQIVSDTDGYAGFVALSDLGQPQQATHRVVALATHAYAEPSIKARDLCSLPFGALLTVTGTDGRFSQTVDGAFIPSMHLARARAQFNDPVAVAELFLGTPYLWGGNSRLGLDCSGLVQTALHACGVPCPGDSDDQEAQLGEALPEGVPLARGDLLFWKGHVSMMIDGDTMIHSTAHYMSTVYEPVADAIRRIDAQGEGLVTSIKRLAQAMPRAAQG